VSISRRLFSIGAIGAIGAVGVGSAIVFPPPAFARTTSRFLGCLDYSVIRRHRAASTPRPTPWPSPRSAAEAADLLARRRAEEALQNTDRGVMLKTAIWPKGARLKVSFIDGTPLQQRRVKTHAPVWSEYSGLTFAFVPAPDGDIRISFEPGSLSYSAIGTEATTIRVGDPTMTLAQLADTLGETDARALVLHEFGHALGLVHEHQNPAAGIHWNQAAAFKYYGGRPFYLTPSEISSQILDAFDETSTNHSKFDPQSIMVYPIPASVTDGAFEVRLNLDLSALDKSFVASQYR